MFGIGLDEMTVVGVLAVLLFDEQKAAQAWKWWRSTRAKMLNFKTDFEQKITDQVHEIVDLKPLAETNTAILDLRKQSRFRLKNTDAQGISDRSQKITQFLVDFTPFKSANHMAAFAPLAKEPQILDLLKEWLNPNRQLYFPRIQPETTEIELVLISDIERDLISSHYGILEPKADLPAALNPPLDLILVPGLVFGLAGERMGKGKGYYDRLLSSFPNTRKTAIAFEMQVFNTYIPQNLHDVPMDDLITDAVVRTFEATRSV